MKCPAYSLITLLLAPGGVPAVADEATVIMPMDGKSDTESNQGVGKVDSVNIKARRGKYLISEISVVK